MTRANRRSLQEPLVIFGAGGHGSVVLDAAIAAGFSVRMFVDDQPKASELFGVPVVTSTDLAPFHFIVAIGENASRARIFRMLSARGCTPVRVIHPAAVVSPHSTLGSGVCVCAGAIISASTIIGDNCIVSIGALVDHGCTVGDHTHIGVGARLGGRAEIGSECLIGPGATVVSGVKIGDRCVVGPMGVVERDILGGIQAIERPVQNVK